MAAAGRTTTGSTAYVANHVYTPHVTATTASGPTTPLFVNSLDTLKVSDGIATVVTAMDVTRVDRDWGKQDEDSKWFGVRVLVKDGDETVSGTVTGAYTTTRGDRAAYVLADGVKTPWVRLLKDVTVQQHRLPNGKWVPVRKKVNGKPE
jgi:hypothetical protein